MDFTFGPHQINCTITRSIMSYAAINSIFQSLSRLSRAHCSSYYKLLAAKVRVKLCNIKKTAHVCNWTEKYIWTASLLKICPVHCAPPQKKPNHHWNSNWTYAIIEAREKAYLVFIQNHQNRWAKKSSQNSRQTGGSKEIEYNLPKSNKES